jgi:hypothetical protein
VSVVQAMEARMVDQIARLTRSDVRRLLDVEEGFLLELEQESIIICDAEGCYPRQSLERIRLCYTLYEDLGLNMPVLEVALHLIDRLHAELDQFRQVLTWLKEQLEAKE